MKPWRDAVRALVVDPSDRILLVRFDYPPYPWALPGGGREEGESDLEALGRELAEEVGLGDFELGPLIWTRSNEFPMRRWRGQRERAYLVRVEPFEPAPTIDLAAEHLDAVRWWTVAEILASSATFAPRRLGALVRELLGSGPPAQPLELGL